MNHHTHDKGDKGTGFVIADLIRHGFKICLPISSHLPFDLIAVSSEGRLFRLQVKYRTMYTGRISVSATTQSISPGKWAKSKPIDRTWIDGWAVYCPDTNAVYYFKVSELGNKTYFYLRIESAKNCQVKGVVMADGYLDPQRLLT